MTEAVIERRRTGWDIVFGILLIIGGLVVLGDVVIATVVSVLFIGWMTLAMGIVGIIASLFRIGKPGFWSAILTGGLLTVLGIVFVRNPGLTAVTLTLFAGFAFLVGGIVRIVAAFETTSSRWILALGGIASLVLGVIVLFNIVDASLTLLGLLLGIQILIDGITLLFVGRLHLRDVPIGSQSTAPVR